MEMWYDMPPAAFRGRQCVGVEEYVALNRFSISEWVGSPFRGIPDLIRSMMAFGVLRWRWARLDSFHDCVVGQRRKDQKDGDDSYERIPRRYY
jgi:hypothetical protein